MTTIRDRLVAAFADGNLLRTIADLNKRQRDDDREVLAHEVVEAHNAGCINAVTSFRGLMNANGSEFWLTRRVFEEALPELSALVREVMECCDHGRQRLYVNAQTATT